MMAAIARGDQADFKDRKPPKIIDKKLIKEKKAKTEKAQEKAAVLRALRLAAHK